jgi:hypothetical protein
METSRYVHPHPVTALHTVNNSRIHTTQRVEQVMLLILQWIEAANRFPFSTPITITGFAQNLDGSHDFSRCLSSIPDPTLHIVEIVKQ